MRYCCVIVLLRSNIIIYVYIYIYIYIYTLHLIKNHQINYKIEKETKKDQACHHHEGF